MDKLEILVGDWLTRQGCHWIFVEQSPGSSADGAIRSKPYQVIHRPDFIAFIDGFGSIAIDAKSYNYQTSTAPLEVIDELSNAEIYDLPISWVKISWDDICGLFEFQRVSNIPVWLCIVDENDAKGERAAWFRVSYIYESFSRIFISEEIGLYPPGARASIPYFDHWPEIKLHKDSQLGVNSDAYVFQLLTEDPEHIDIIGLSDNGMKVYVPPRVINLSANSSLSDLINIWPAKAANPQRASNKSISYANAIAKALNEPLPDDRSQHSISGFISRHEEAFKAKRK